MAVLKRLEQNRGRSIASNVPPEWLLVSSAFSFIYRVTHNLSDKVPDHCSRPQGVVASASDRFERGLRCIVEVLRAAERELQVYTASLET